MDEIWRDVPGWEDVYQVSNHGRVRSLDRVTLHRGHPRRYRGRVLSPSLRGRYDSVALYRDGKAVYPKVHRLVALAFHGPCPPGQIVRHGPLGKRVNTPENLCYGTYRQNMVDDCKRDGTFLQGTRRSNAKLTEPDIPIVRLFARTLTQREVARLFGISGQTVNEIVNGKAWNHVG